LFTQLANAAFQLSIQFHDFFVCGKSVNMGDFFDTLNELDSVNMCELCGVRPAVVRGIVWYSRSTFMCLECAEREVDNAHEHYTNWFRANGDLRCSVNGKVI
jgi:hypothetical protein